MGVLITLLSPCGIIEVNKKQRVSHTPYFMSCQELFVKNAKIFIDTKITILYISGTLNIKGVIQWARTMQEPKVRISISGYSNPSRKNSALRTLSVRNLISPGPLCRAS
jgi:hypothetical protein